MWGSLGWAVMATLSGLLVQRTSLISIFYEFGAITTLAILVLFLVKTPPQKSVEQLTAIKSPRIPMRQVLLDMFKNRELTAFMVALVVMWIGSNGTSFESVFLQQLGAKTNLIGTINTVGALVEIPMMLIADRVMRRQGSAKTLLAGVCSYLLASAIIVIHPSIASFFIYRMINGVSMGLYAVSFTYFIVERAPAQQTVTMLALYSVTIAGMVSILMSPVSGWIFDRVGAYWLYVIALTGYTTAATIIYFGVVKKKRKTI
jgi:MFS family permease